MTTTIKHLDPITVTKIAAGEVIDRPASIVKELIENSLDAGATYIRVEVEDGGKRLIRITDNGFGMSKEDLVLAPLPHTTSKISTLEDLYETATFGFRGEALASVCHVAKVSITSRQKDGQAYRISIRHSDVSTPEACAAPIGTTIDIQDLFFDIPVRQRFLKTGATELSYITEHVIHFALSHPSVDFVLISNGLDMINSTGISDEKSLLVHFYGKNLRSALVPIDSTIGPVHFSGFITDPTQTFSNRSKQITTVNGRLIKSPVIQRALSESTKDIMPAKRYPLILLHIRTDGQSVDVNVHPQKLDVKFINPGFLFDALPKALSISLQMHAAPMQDLSSFSAQRDPNVFSSSLSNSYTNSVIPPSSPDIPAQAGIQSSPFSSGNSFDSRLRENNVITPTQKQVLAASELFNPMQLDTAFPLPTKPLQNDASLTFFQLFNTYIGIPTPTGLYLLDQHAVHERILYEDIKAQFGKDSSRQPLLISEFVELSSDLMAVFEESSQFFIDLNFVLEPFGPTSIVVREVPLTFSDANCSELVLDILVQLKEFPGSSRNLTLDQKEKLQMKACKAAIKAGKKMHPKEVEQLVKDVVRSPSNYTCPHGRPLCLFFDKTHLERLFLRS